MAGVKTEHRRYDRCSVSVPAALRFQANRAMLDARSANLGIEGACFQAHGVVRLGAKVLVQLEFGEAGPPIECKGMVCWVMNYPEGLSRFGVRFLDLGDDEREMLSQVTDNP